MKETIKISIGGLAFILNIDAYDRLSYYLDSIKEFYENKEDGNEIISDIEFRISELLQIQTGGRDEAVSIENIDYIIGIMGSPSEFLIDEETNSQKKARTISENKKTKKKLYRDLDNKIIGGVCSGLGQYTKTDPVLIRIITLLLIFGGNIFINKLSFYTIIFYLVLWAIIPAAKSMQQKIAMFDKNYSFDEFNQKKGRRNELRGSVLGRILLKTLKISCSIILFIVGLSLAIIPIIWIYFSYVMSVPSIGDIAETLGLSSLNTNISILLISIIPAIVLVFVAVRLLTTFKKADLKIICFAILLWIVSFTFFSKISIGEAKEYKVKAEYNKELIIAPKYDTLYISIDKLYSEANPLLPNSHIYINSDKPFSWFILPKINIVKDENFKDLKISINNYAWAKNYEQAKANAKEDKNIIMLQDSILKLEPQIFTKQNNYDRRYSEITIYTPINKEVIIEESIKEWIEMDRNPSNREYRQRYAFTYTFD